MNNCQGKILVATPKLTDAFFKESVVIVTEHHSKGSVGFVLNKTSNYNFQDIAKSKGWDTAFNDTVYTSGPVNSSALITLHSNEWFSSNTYIVTKEMSISSDDLMIEKLITGNIPRKYRLLKGMSGWSPGQLEYEIQNGHWLLCEPKESIIFHYEGTEQWRKALEVCASEVVNSYF